MRFPSLRGYPVYLRREGHSSRYNESTVVLEKSMGRMFATAAPVEHVSF